MICQGCGASAWKDGSCLYCERLDRSIDFILDNAGESGLIGSWKNGVLLNGRPFDNNSFSNSYDKNRFFD